MNKSFFYFNVHKICVIIFKTVWQILVIWVRFFENCVVCLPFGVVFFYLHFVASNTILILKKTLLYFTKFCNFYILNHWNFVFWFRSYAAVWIKDTNLMIVAADLNCNCSGVIDEVTTMEGTPIIYILLLPV